MAGDKKADKAPKRKTPDSVRKAAGAGEQKEAKVPKAVSGGANAGVSLDDIFASATIKGKSGGGKLAHAKPDGADGGAKAHSTGPDMEQVQKEAALFLSGGGGQRTVVDGVKVYSEAELAKEMGEDAWQAFEEAADESLAKGMSSKDYW
mmetsp:Transcript_61734/g.90517  ORF Transcript_61734/g.90517 Transcript_61734/m.90517 type:complete len:149 (+) Transcript_61734:51-497(+)